MFNKVLQITLLGFIWKRYSKLIVTTIFLFAYFWIVSRIHTDYLKFAELNDGNENIGFSFILKWIAFLTGVGIYALFNTYHKLPKIVPNNNPGSGNSNLTKINNKNTSTKVTPDSTDNKSDPFSELRKKDKLRSKAEIIIDNKENR